MPASCFIRGGKKIAFLKTFFTLSVALFIAIREHNAEIDNIKIENIFAIFYVRKHTTS